MAIDALTAQLLTGGQGGGIPLGAIDPALAAATPEIQLGQQLAQQGTSTAPAYPGAALARALQGAIGATMQKSGYSDLANAYANAVPKLAQLYEGTPLGDAFKSGNPIAIQAALKSMPTVMATNSEKEKLGPSDILVAGRTKVAQSDQPQSTEGKIAADAQRAPAPVATALGRVLTKAGSNEATGVLYPPVPVQPQRPPVAGISAPTAAIQPPQANANQPTPQQLASAKARLAQNLTDVQNSGVTNPTPTGVQSMPEAVAAAKGAQSQAEEAGKANVEYGSFRNGQQGPTSGPGISVPMPTDHGTQIPPVNAQATIPSDPGVIKEKLPAWQKTVTDWSNSVAPAQLAQQRLTTIANAFKSIKTGTFTTEKAQLAAALKAAGLDASGILGDPAQAQLALHENYAETMNQLKAATSRFTQQEFRITSENKEHPNIQPEANLQMLAEDLGSLKQQTDLANDWNQASKNGWKDPQSYQTEFLKLNKLPDYVAREKQAIGPLKGMQQLPARQQSAGTSVHSPAAVEAEMRRRGLIQ